MWRDLISEIVHALSFLISEKGQETAKLNIEVEELLKTLNEFNVGLTVVPWLIQILIDLF